MRSPSRLSIDDTHLFMSGNVVVHDSAAIAPDVLLQADPDSQIVIAAGVCIGSGSVLHAHQGKLVLEAGATLGSGVLVVGYGTIGSEACIGSMTTIINCSVEAKQSVPPGSLLGDGSRQGEVHVEQAQSKQVQPTMPPVTPPIFPAPVSSPPLTSSPPPATANSDSSSETSAPPMKALSEKVVTQVYGRAYLQRMMVTMFPYRQALAASSEDTDSDESKT
ncbi:MAG TPA: hypothetical protein V6D10_22405 [Trichocoleus sp.]|jgi:carbon dioxide concentrating mechanism protein CcmN